ncbi:MAG: 50S ribosomal protein L4 [Syntrophales bacterium]|nr:50S ribosomal protein L4 [Syntrophales bacterium]PKN05010.1 MAG: 50S ribosomal protein L4 [Deltaproteobacteria bacterium HGW-Deltaproteobacteria-9]
MAFLDVYDIDNNKVSQLEVSDAVFGVEANAAAVYETVRMQMLARRLGTASTKERGEIRGGGKKPWRQKGTGRARAGTSRSPLWRGGGTVFGPHLRDYSIRVPKKVRKLALISALSVKMKEQRILVLRDFPLTEIKTKKFKEVFDRFGLRKALFVIDRSNPVLEKSSRNIQGVKLIRAEGINVYDLLDHDHVIFLEPSVKMIEGALMS